MHCIYFKRAVIKYLIQSYITINKQICGKKIDRKNIW